MLLFLFVGLLFSCFLLLLLLLFLCSFVWFGIDLVIFFVFVAKLTDVLQNCTHGQLLWQQITNTNDVAVPSVCPIHFVAKCHSVSNLKSFGWHTREMCLTCFGATERKKGERKKWGGGGGRISVSYRILTPSLPWCHLKTTNKTAKLKCHKPFRLLFLHWHVKGSPSKCRALKVDVL